MYLPPHFEEARTAELHRFIAAHPLGALVVNGPNGLDANHIPFLLDPAEPCGGPARLIAHVARANPVWRDVARGAPVLVIFGSAGAYISPNWYPTKADTHRVVPTWNYEVVHVHGTFSVHDDEKFIRGVIGRLTREHEARVSPGRPWKMSDAPRDFLDQMVSSIIGISVTVTQMVGKRKLGQNRDDGDRLAAAEALEGLGDAATASAMRKARE